jgi:hypothetical protein
MVATKVAKKMMPCHEARTSSCGCYTVANQPLGDLGRIDNDIMIVILRRPWIRISIVQPSDVERRPSRNSSSY